MEKMCVASRALDLSETKTYIELTNRLCYYGKPNLNGITLPVEKALEKAETLVNQPVVAKYRVNSEGNPDLGGHEMFRNPLSQEIEFGTATVGTHVSAYVADDEVEINGENMILPCLFAKSRIWTRNKNIVKAVKRLFEMGRLFSSWEILTHSFVYEDGIKTLTDYEFEANALLGSNTQPAYGSAACALDISSMNDCQMMIAEAMTQDAIFEGENSMAKKTKEKIEETKEILGEEVLEESKCDDEEKKDSEVTEETKDEEIEKDKEVSSLTDWDIRKKLNKACSSKVGVEVWMSFWFPTEQYCLCDIWDTESELDYLKFSYEILGDEVIVSDPEKIRLAVSVAEINNVVAAKDDALAKASEKIASLQLEVTELLPFKQDCEKAERDRIEAETAQKRNELAEYATRSGYITQEELDNSEMIKSLVENMDKDGINSIIAERFMESLNDVETIVETSEARLEENDVETVVSFEGSSDDIDGASIIQMYLYK